MKLCRGDVLENFGLDAGETFYQQNESIICHSSEGFFMFYSADLDYARLLSQSDPGWFLAYFLEKEKMNKGGRFTKAGRGCLRILRG